mmetsp:Transcript_7127/g.10618  ORF Transcript_7127/g.10618 Transcript_7127/m.10618 type:complete len:268 (+) Transcript_7127:106-909(+)|eukprot:CAMPEP_0185024412 /NCGR_PEP_ID=MMETSP1103-20130426/7461_1 /TAXON_ID=36769 /ORGANISM="Paraphysomonas bandaiensis, Strain Caron Lab Isolate" /LENGTH=267 /DNA_ID=CAMNT_0027557371 /DNA_START=106 /DNA_END=909 /DNA_ORIENTATION=+
MSDPAQPPTKKVKVEPTTPSWSDSDDDIPIAEMLRRRGVAVKKEPVTHDDDDEDDIPVAELVKRKQQAKNTKPAAATASAASRKSQSKVSNSSTSAKSTSAASKRPDKSKPSVVKAMKGDPMASSTIPESFYQTTKGNLVQRLLVRWWYAISWPDEASLDACPGEGYEPLEGFPGVFVCTSMDNMGAIVDQRDMSTCPSLRNLSKKSSAELKDLCVQAYEEQIRQLIAAEGPDTLLERSLIKELKAVKAINTNKADREVAKSFKAGI